LSVPAAKRWFLYLIECRGGSVYTGITVDVAARYAAHASGKGGRYTRSHPPLRLLAVAEYATRSLASKAEYRVKQLKAGSKRALVRDLLGEEALRILEPEGSAPPQGKP
jgi:putative endonuclease